MHPPANNAPSVDIRSSVDIESIVRQVVHALKKLEVVSAQPVVARANTFVFDQRVITLDDISGVPVAMTTIEIPAGGIVTPAVRDEVKTRGITVVHAASRASGGVPGKAGSSAGIHTPFRPIHLRHDETIDSGLLESIQKQVTTRGVKLCDQASTAAMLSNRPAAAVYRCITEGVSAVLINRMDDVTRFKNELKPTVYVLDVHHLNLMSLVNAVVQIARRGNQAGVSPAGSLAPVVTVAGGQK